MDPIALAAAGPWAVVVAMGSALAWAFLRGHIVPGFVYQREVRRADLNADLLPQVVKAMEDMASALREFRRG